MRIAVIAGIFSVLCGFCLGAEPQWPQTLNDVADCRALADKIIAEVAKGRTKEALSEDRYWCGTGRLDVKYAAMAFAAKEDALSKVFGPCLNDGVEYLGRASISNNWCVFAYFIKRAGIVSPWLLHFCRPQREWKLACLQEGKDAEAVTFLWDRVTPSAKMAFAEAGSGEGEMRDNNAGKSQPKPIRDRESCREIAYWLMNEISRKKAGEPLFSPTDGQEIVPQLPWTCSKSELDRVGRFYSQAASKAEMEYGRAIPQRFDFLGRLDVGTCLSIFVFAMEHEQRRCEWKLFFYKAENEWRLNELWGPDQCLFAIRLLAKATSARDVPLKACPVFTNPPELANVADCRALADHLMAGIARGRIEESLMPAERYWCGTGLRAMRHVATTHLRAERERLEEFGPVVENGLEYLGQMERGKSGCSFAYIVKHRRKPVLWFLHFDLLGGRWKFAAIDVENEKSSEISLFVRVLPASGRGPLAVGMLEGGLLPGGIDGGLQAWPERIPDKETCKRVADRLIGEISRGKADEVIFSALEHYEHRHPLYPPGLPISRIQTLAWGFTADDRKAESILGPVISGRAEYMGRLDTGNCICDYVYYVDRERGAYRWTIRFYKSEDQWRLCTLKAFGDLTFAINSLIQATPAGPERAETENR